MSVLPTGPTVDEPVVICVAPNGARRTKAEHPALPISAAELAEEAARCRQAGAVALHLHVRDAEGRHTLDAHHYGEAITAIRERVGQELLIQITTEAVGRYLPEQQRAVVRAVMPEAASVALREMMPSAASVSEAAQFYAFAHEAGIAVQHILYDVEEVAWLISLVRSGLIPEPAAALFVLGRYGAAAQLEPRALAEWVRLWPREWPWSVCGFGRAEPRMLAAAIGLGGHVRVGFENNLLTPEGAVAIGNAHNVTNCVEIARRCGRSLADRHLAFRVLGGANIATAVAAG